MAYDWETDPRDYEEDVADIEETEPDRDVEADIQAAESRYEHTLEAPFEEPWVCVF